jgi:3-phenylpropionate/cinnamic acid dioxygenase small subunit
VSADIDRVVAQHAIRDLLLRYCRGVDRRQYDVVRSCYHDDATDDHGDYTGGVDGFIDHVRKQVERYESTMHFVGNMLIEPDARLRRARSETYTIAFHRLAPRGNTPARDFVVGLRYVDDLDVRSGEWRIAARVCVIDWTRLDAVAPRGWSPTAAYVVGRADGTDAVFAPSLRDLGR